MVYRAVCDLASCDLSFLPLIHSIPATLAFWFTEQTRHTSTSEPLPLFPLPEKLFTQKSAWLNP